MTKAKKEKTEQDPFIDLAVEEGVYRTLTTRNFERRIPYKPIDPNKLTAFIPGTIKKMATAKGKKVKKGDVLCMLDAMKMNNLILAPFDGTIKDVFVKDGDKVEKNQVLVEMK
ncbi:MAG: biotin/lipoyl-containing protein [Bacteroidota bacterium]